MRILSLAPSNTEILFALGQEDNIIGVTAFCDYPKEARDKERIGAWINTEPEKIKALKPDYIFTSYFIPPPLRGWKGPGKLVHVAPKTLSDVFQSILHIGSVVKAKKRAESIVSNMKTSFAQIEKNRPKKKLRVYMEEWFEPPMASGNWVPELIAIAGGTEGIAKKGQPSNSFSIEELIFFDADCMIFHWCGFGKRFDKEKVKKRNGWENLRAIREDNLFVIDDSLLNRPGPRLAQGAEQIQTIPTSLQK